MLLPREQNDSSMYNVYSTVNKQTSLIIIATLLLFYYYSRVLITSKIKLAAEILCKIEYKK